MPQLLCNLPLLSEYSPSLTWTTRFTLLLLLVVVPCNGWSGTHVGPYQVWRPQVEKSYGELLPKMDRVVSYDGRWQPTKSYGGWRDRMGRSEDSYEDSDEDSFWDEDYSSEDYSAESKGSEESNSEDSSREKESSNTSDEDSSIEIEEDYSSYESEEDFWGDYSEESEDDSLEDYSEETVVSSSEYDGSEEDFWDSTSDEEESSENDKEELQDAIDETYSLRDYYNTYYPPSNADLVTRIGIKEIAKTEMRANLDRTGGVDNLVRTYSSS